MPGIKLPAHSEPLRAVDPYDRLRRGVRFMLKDDRAVYQMVETNRRACAFLPVNQNLTAIDYSQPVRVMESARLLDQATFL
jgi:hypothetical protein